MSRKDDSSFFRLWSTMAKALKTKGNSYAANETNANVLLIFCCRATPVNVFPLCIFRCGAKYPDIRHSLLLTIMRLCLIKLSAPRQKKTGRSV